MDYNKSAVTVSLYQFSRTTLFIKQDISDFSMFWLQFYKTLFVPYLPSYYSVLYGVVDYYQNTSQEIRRAKCLGFTNDSQILQWN